MTRLRVALVAALVVAIAATIAIVAYSPARDAQCGPGFRARGPRCCAGAGEGRDGCAHVDTCPAPLVASGGDCTAPRIKVTVPETTVTIGPSDWEAEGLVAPRTIHVGRFAIDAFELTRADVTPGLTSDGARAAVDLDLARARSLCAARGGRLPTEDEWIAAAATEKGHRYPWGDTGLVCRRAAFGLEAGPCAQGATGPDTVGAHPDGDGAGIHDLAGNAAEWVEPRAGATAGKGVLRGGSWRSTLAADLRIWSRAEVAASFHDATTGARCAYDGLP
jgi:formylglycine-generating enzyme required for sulfatase activity